MQVVPAESSFHDWGNMHWFFPCYEFFFWLCIYVSIIYLFYEEDQKAVVIIVYIHIKYISVLWRGSKGSCNYCIYILLPSFVFIRFLQDKPIYLAPVFREFFFALLSVFFLMGQRFIISHRPSPSATILWDKKAYSKTLFLVLSNIKIF